MSALGKVLLYFTIFDSSLDGGAHNSFLKAWPGFLAHLPHLRMADVLIYVGSAAPKEQESDEFQPLLDKFPNQWKTLRTGSNPGYKEDAIAAIRIAENAGWFKGYDWVIRLSPDVIVYDETYLVKLMSQDLDAVICNCVHHCLQSGQQTCTHISVHTDFIAFRPRAVSWNVSGYIADYHATAVMHNVFASNRYALLIPENRDVFCRARGNGVWHQHGDPNQILMNAPWNAAPASSLPAKPPAVSSSLHYFSKHQLITVGNHHQENLLSQPRDRVLTPVLLNVMEPSLIALLVGALLLPSQRTAGLMFVFFGGQSLMSLYMKYVLSEVTISASDNITGVPAPFFVTGLQQFVCLVLLLLIILVKTQTSQPYYPKKLQTAGQVLPIICLAAAFFLNIGLNNLSVSLLDISLNAMIRSTTPFFALLLEQLRETRAIMMLEWGLVLGGLVCVAVAALAKSSGHVDTDADGFGMDATWTWCMGIITCVVSVFFSAAELVIVKRFAAEKDCKLNVFDAILYVTVPAIAFIAPCVFFFEHYVSWPTQGVMTDWEVVKIIAAYSPESFALVVLSGVFALAYNFLIYTFTQELSPCATAVSSQLNKVVTVFLSVHYGWERLPEKPWNYVMCVSAGVALAFFTLYGYLKAAKKL